MTTHKGRHPLRQGILSGAAKERCMKHGNREIRTELMRFLDKAGDVQTKVSRRCGEPLRLIDLSMGYGAMVPGVGLGVGAGDSIALRSRKMEFRVFFSGFNRAGRLVCELYVDDKYVRKQALGPGQSMECRMDPEAQFRVTRREASGKPGFATISVWADTPERKIRLY